MEQSLLKYIHSEYDDLIDQLRYNFSQLLWDANIIDEGLLQMKKFGPKHPWGWIYFSLRHLPLLLASFLYYAR